MPLAPGRVAMVAVVVVAMVMAPRGLTRYLYEGLMFSVAGLVAEVKLAGYPAAYVEEDVAGRTSIAWDARVSERLCK